MHVTEMDIILVCCDDNGKHILSQALQREDGVVIDLALDLGLYVNRIRKTHARRSHRGCNAQPVRTRMATV